MLSVTVVIPTYNCSQYINQAVASALKQKVNEIIVVDDGSTDQTHLALAKVSDTRLRYVKQSNRGVSAARNQGIRLAGGELIAFLDADDWFLPNKLIQQAALFEENPDLGLVQCGWQRVDATGRQISAVKPWKTVPNLTLENWLKFKPVLPSALMVKRDWLLKVNGFDTHLKAAEDVDLVCRLALKGCTSAWLPEVGVAYRQRTSSAMGDGLTQATSLLRFLDKFFRQPHLPATAKLLERSTRYHTLVWAAWYLYQTEHLPEMADYLRKAWRYTPYLPADALIHWIDSFKTFSKEGDNPLRVESLVQSQEWQELVCWLLSQKI